ncbi:hypothetical protein AB0467_13240 [Streptomyces sp. NPDC052095]|uniref:hypothetical protein n=1 Tax=unclassified Streptomyces TaxID=2593676 RepID=UPI00345080CF
MTSDAGLSGNSRVTVFVMFGMVLGYATHHLDQRRIGDVAIVGPLTPGVGWERLWQVARACGRPSADETELARWVLVQATRAFVCGSDRVALLHEQGWKLAPGGKRIRFDAAYANRDQLWTGELTVDGLAAGQVVERAGYYTV